MSRKIVAQKKFTVLIRKLTLQHDLTFMSISQNAGETKTLKATSECLLNEEIPVIVYEDGTKNHTVFLNLVRYNSTLFTTFIIRPFKWELSHSITKAKKYSNHYV